ncbi:DUF1364 family protein [Pseudomonas sp. L-22-4S-12]|uniref:nuclease domain-containing protein n=1 Tax=Pseudomonas sp. L-22-4S-12 TaxID=2610893 RepID=UPI00132BAA60|nr:nuclease domain-containing protein [Pseudomonas sp. L-22-4S-12]MWV17544.1 DUF1364 family protein [Pseudomonas sp. L-22-4S-12]
MGSIVSNAVRDSARDENCTLNIAGVCNYQPETTVFAHLPDESKGMGTKSDDLSGCYACHACHDAIDSRSKSGLSAEDREWYMRRAMVRTWRRMHDKGLLVIKGVRS